MAKREEVESAIWKALAQFDLDWATDTVMDTLGNVTDFDDPTNCGFDTIEEAQRICDLANAPKEKEEGETSWV